MVNESIDKMMSYYKENKLSVEQMQERLLTSENKINEMERLTVEEFGRDSIKRGADAVREMGPDGIEAYAKRSKALVDGFIAAIGQGLDAGSEEVQRLVQEHYDLTFMVHPMGMDEYLDLRRALRADSPFYKYYMELHPKLPEFLYEAMGIFVEED